MLVLCFNHYHYLCRLAQVVNGHVHHQQHLADSWATLNLDGVALLSAADNLIKRLLVNLLLDFQSSPFCLHYPTRLGYGYRKWRMLTGMLAFYVGKKLKIFLNFRGVM